MTPIPRYSSLRYSPHVAYILGINGSIRPGSSADRALRFALAAAEREGAATATFDIGSLPVLDGRPDADYPSAVAEFRAACQAAGALLITIPVYHGALPGGLKNALDFIDEPHVAGKPFALIGIAGGDAEPGVTDVTRVLRHIAGVAAVRDVVISRAGEAWGRGDQPASAAVGEAVDRLVRDLVAVCRLRGEGRLPG